MSFSKAYMPLAVLLLSVATACSDKAGEEAPRRGEMSELDSLRAMQPADGTASRYDGSMPDGTFGRAMHSIAATETMPVACYGGETLHIKCTARGRCRIALYDATNRKVLGTREVNPEIEWSVPVASDGIYALQVSPVEGSEEAPSASYTITFSGNVRENRPAVAVNMVSASRDDMMAYATKGLRTVNVFKEPKRIALRGHMKAAFSGYSRGIVTVPVPDGADLLVYSLRVSNNENTVASDGKFANRLTTSYNKVKLLGIPVYEGSSHYSLGSMLMDTRPPREDDAFCNLFVFDTADAARKFQNTSGDAGTFDYNVDLSQIGTQSCTGELPCAGRSSLYLGFENERIRYDTYIWLEVTAIVKKTEYLKPEFSIKQ